MIKNISSDKNVSNSSSPIKILNNSEEYNTYKNEQNILIFTADWCGPCVRIKPFINETILKYNSKINNKNINFIYINIDKCLSLSELFNITLLPTIIITNNNKEKHRLLNKNIDNLSTYIENL